MSGKFAVVLTASIIIAALTALYVLTPMALQPSQYITISVVSFPTTSWDAKTVFVLTITNKSPWPVRLDWLLLRDTIEGTEGSVPIVPERLYGIQIGPFGSYSTSYKRATCVYGPSSSIVDQTVHLTVETFGFTLFIHSWTMKESFSFKY